MVEELKNMLEDAIKKEKMINLAQLSKAVEKVISEDQEIKAELSLMGDMAFNLKIDPILEMSVQIKGGEISFNPDLAEKRDFFMDIPIKTISKIMAGEKDVISPFMSGEIRMWREGDVGDMSKAMDLLPLIIILAEKLGIKM